MTTGSELAERRAARPISSLYRRGRRWIGRGALSSQMAALGAVCTGLMWLAGSCLPSDWLDHQAFPWTLMILSAGLVTAVLSWRAHLAMQALQRLTKTAQALRSDPQQIGAELPLATGHGEAVALTLAVRRLVMSMQRQHRRLESLKEAVTARLQVRTHELSTLQDLSIGLSQHAEVHELVGEALKALEQTLDFSTASLWAREDLSSTGRVVLMGYRTEGRDAGTHAQTLEGLRLSRSNLEHYERVERDARPLVDNDVRHNFWSWLIDTVTDDARTSVLYRRSRSWMALPLSFRDEVLGVLRIDHEAPGYFDEARIRLLTAVGSQTALAMRQARLTEASRELAVMAERHRIARDLHDAVSQTLFAANLLAGSLSKAMRSVQDERGRTLSVQAQQLERLTRGAQAEMRLLMLELRPDALQGMSVGELLKQAIDAMAGRSELVVDARVAQGDALSSTMRTQVYRIAQEALSNVSRHSGATLLTVQWQVRGPQAAWLLIQDNGGGFDPDQRRPGHFGLDNMQARAHEMGARLTITSAPGQGTSLRLELGDPHDAA